MHQILATFCCSLFKLRNATHSILVPKHCWTGSDTVDSGTLNSGTLNSDTLNSGTLNIAGHIVAL